MAESPLVVPAETAAAPSEVAFDLDRALQSVVRLSSPAFRMASPRRAGHQAHRQRGHPHPDGSSSPSATSSPRPGRSGSHPRQSRRCRGIRRLRLRDRHGPRAALGAAASLPAARQRRNVTGRDGVRDQPRRPRTRSGEIFARREFAGCKIPSRRRAIHVAPHPTRWAVAALLIPQGRLTSAIGSLFVQDQPATR